MSMMEEMRTSLLRLIVLSSVLSGTGYTDTTIETILVQPSVTVTSINDSAFFSCSTTSQKVEWLFGSDQYPQSVIYSYGKVNLLYKDRFQVESYSYNNRKWFDLILRSTAKGDAGRYICRDPDNLNEEGREVHLVALETEPACDSNLNSDGLIIGCGVKPETIQLSCSVRYNGEKIPELQWIKTGENIVINSSLLECSDSGSIYTCNLTMESELQMEGSSYVCQTTQSMTRQYNCTSDVFRIIYVLDEHTELTKTVNDKVNCSVNSNSQACTLSWIFDNGTTNWIESHERGIQFKRPGRFICQASCAIRNNNCTFATMTVNVTVRAEPQDDDKHIVNKGLVVGIVVGAVVVTAICVIAFILWIRRKKKREKGQNASNNQGTPEREVLLRGEIYLRDRIEAHKELITDRLDPDFGLLDELFASRSLTRSEVSKVKAISHSYERSERLLEYVFYKGFYEKFLDALRRTQQTHLANFILSNGKRRLEYGDDWPLTEREIYILDANQRTLIDLLDISDLLPRLYSHEIVNNQQRDFVSSRTVCHKKNEALLEILRRTSLQNYKETIDCLRLSNQSHIANLFEGDVDEDYIARLITPKADENRNKRVRGLTILEEKLFVVFETSNIIEVFPVNSYMSNHESVVVKDLVNPGTIAACVKNSCLYVMDQNTYSNKKIFRVKPDGTVIKIWETDDDDKGRISVNRDGNLVMTAYDKGKVKMYSPDGILLRDKKINLSRKKITHIFHAINLADGNFIIAHGIYKSKLHQVCKINGKGNVLKSFGNEKGSGDAQLDCPAYLAERNDGSILVADQGNDRIILLNSELEFVKELFTKENCDVSHPEFMFVYEETEPALFFLGCNETRNSGGYVLVLRLDQ